MLEVEYFCLFGETLTNGRVFSICTYNRSGLQQPKDAEIPPFRKLTIYLLDCLQPSGDTFSSIFHGLVEPCCSIESFFAVVILNRIAEEIVWPQNNES